MADSQYSPLVLVLGAPLTACTLTSDPFQPLEVESQSPEMAAPVAPVSAVCDPDCDRVPPSEASLMPSPPPDESDDERAPADRATQGPDSAAQQPSEPQPPSAAMAPEPEEPPAVAEPEGVEPPPSVPDRSTVGGAGAGPDCKPIADSSISDFTFLPGGNASEVRFGVDAAFPGVTYFYPVGGSLASDVTEDDWHLSGTVDAISGFGLDLGECQPLDASGFQGIAFTLWGNIEGDRPLTFYIETAAQQVSSRWSNENEADLGEPDAAPNSGRCVPANGRYDGTCREPRVLLTVSSEPTSVELTWAEFTGGSPVPDIRSSELTSMAWSLPRARARYDFDIHIDDLRFIERRRTLR
jgi:hypothetical protein